MDFNPDAAQDNGGGEWIKGDPGEYILEVHDAEERVSSKGNPMIALSLKFIGHPRWSYVRDYLVATDAAMFKVKQFCDACGLTAQFNSGRLNEAHCIRRRVRARVSDQQDPGYDPKLVVDEYLPSGESDLHGDMAQPPMPEERRTGVAHPDTPKQIDEDDIPF